MGDGDDGSNDGDYGDNYDSGDDGNGYGNDTSVIVLQLVHFYVFP